MSTSTIFILPIEVVEIILTYVSLDVDILFKLRTVSNYFNKIIQNIKCLNLNLQNNRYPLLCDEDIRGLINLTPLNLCDNELITDEGIRGLINLTSLNLYGNKLITNEGIRGLINLNSLNLDGNKLITDDCIRGLINLNNI